jgi:Neuraminidase (sialidase)
VDSTGAVSGPDQIMYSYSGDNGNNWSAEQQVNSPAVTGENTNVNVFPWIAAGDPGKIDVVWYGTANSNGNYNWQPDR